MKGNDKDLQDIVYKSPSSIDELVSRELLQLSLKDRNVIDEEIHGVSTLAPKENPKFLKVSLQELFAELNRIPDESPLKAAYLKSQTHPETYVNDSGFRLRFLRCELFDAKKAAIRMLKFLDFASHLFGTVVLKRPLRITDLSKEERKWMRAGNIQALPYRDQSGRLIWAQVGDFETGEQDSPISRWKVTFYLRYCMSDNIESQQKGYVHLIWVGSNDASLPKWEDFEYSKKMCESTPIRKCSVHWCLPHLPLFHPVHTIRSMHALSLDKDKSRMKFHVGEQVELLYKLKTYGIPTEYIPFSDTGKIKTAYFKQWMKGQTRLEEAREKGSLDALSIILLPRSTDVIFRVGNSLMCHPGNAVFESMIEAKLHKHSAASLKEKVAITKAIIVSVQQQGGRFLQWVKKLGWWTEMEESSIHARVAEKMRRMACKRIADQQTIPSSTLVFQNQDNSKRRKLASSAIADGDSCVEGSCFSKKFFPI